MAEPRRRVAVPPEEARLGQKLFNFVFDNDKQGVQSCIDSGADLNWKDEDGTTPAYIASQNGHVECLERLIAARCSVDQARNTGATPAYIASQNGHVECLERLIAARCNVNQPWKDPSGRLWTPLAKARANGHHDVVAVLKRAGAQ